METIKLEINDELSQRDMINNYVRDIISALEESGEVYISLPEDGREDIVIERILTMIEGYVWMLVPKHYEDKELFHRHVFFHPRKEFVIVKNPRIFFQGR